MPFNTQNEDDSGARRPSTPEPIAPLPQRTGLSAGRIVGIVFFLLVLGAVIFLLYTYGVFNIKRGVKPATTTTQQTEQSPQRPERTTTPETTASPPTSQVIVPDTSQPVPVAIEKKQFSVFIGAYRDRHDAESEVARWREAGYDAFVDDASGWSRVALGHFASTEEARTLVDSLQQAFEQGYWIGPI